MKSTIILYKAMTQDNQKNEGCKYMLMRLSLTSEGKYRFGDAVPEKDFDKKSIGWSLITRSYTTVASALSAATKQGWEISL